MDEYFTEQHKLRRVLTIGDLLIYLLSTFIVYFLVPGDAVLSARLVIETFLPFALVWMVAAPFAGLFRAAIALDPRQLWLVALLALVATQLGAWLGTIWVGKPSETQFILLMTLLATVLVVGWRSVFIWLGERNTH